MKKDKEAVKGKRKVFKTLFYSFAVLFFTVVIVSMIINQIVVGTSKDRIYKLGQIGSVSDMKISDPPDCIIVLGCGVWADGTPTPMLSDRLNTAIGLYERGIAPKILMSGDHGQESYNEVSVMRQYAIDRGVPSEDIFMDHAGFSTYETMKRAKEIFGVRSAVIVTQRYHLFRSLYIAERLGIESVGVEAEGHTFTEQGYYDTREILARTKDFFGCIIEPDPTYLGEKIDIHGNGEVTLD